MKKFFKKFNLFGRSREPESRVSVKDKARQWNRSIQKEVRRIDRDILKMSSDEKRTETEIKRLASKKEIGSVKILARELVCLRKSRNRMLTTKIQLGSIAHQLTQQVAISKLTNSFEKSAEIMKIMNSVINVPNMTEVMSAMGKEMEKMGLIESIMGDAIDEVLADVDTEEKTEIEVNKLMEELAIDNIALMPSAVSGMSNGTRVRKPRVEASKAAN